MPEPSSYADKYDFYNYDMRGSVTNVIAPDGTLITGYSYDEFGNKTQNGDAAFLNEVTFTGSVSDTSSGLQYMNARFYNPETGRFISQDSYTGNTYDPWTQHLYTYTMNNPTNFVDPTGHSAALAYLYMQRAALQIVANDGTPCKALVGSLLNAKKEMKKSGRKQNENKNKDSTEERNKNAYDAITATELGNDIGDFDDLVFDETYDNGAYITHVRKVEQRDGLTCVTSFKVIQGDNKGIRSYANSERVGSNIMTGVVCTIIGGVSIPLGDRSRYI